MVPGIIAVPPPGDHTSSAGARARAGGTPARPVPVHHPHGAQLRQGAAVTLGAPLQEKDTPSHIQGTTAMLTP